MKNDYALLKIKAPKNYIDFGDDTPIPGRLQTPIQPLCLMPVSA